VLIADERGQLIDGDQILAVITRAWQRTGRLTGGGVVATVMSNLGLERWLGEQGLTLQRTQVGDRYVVEQMRALKMNVGGEQSGHMILSDYATTGDGLIAALQVLATIVEEQRPASRVCRAFTPLPQMLRSVRYAQGATPLEDMRVKEAIAEAEGELGVGGRLLIRRSGTEPVIRVMAEGEDEMQVAGVVTRLCELIGERARSVAPIAAQ
jgi:phosphoglucosamine mutase